MCASVTRAPVENEALIASLALITYMYIIPTDFQHRPLFRKLNNFFKHLNIICEGFPTEEEASKKVALSSKEELSASFYFKSAQRKSPFIKGEMEKASEEEKK